MSSQARDYYGRFTVPDGPPRAADGRQPVDPGHLRQRARVAADLAKRAGSPTPSTGLRALAALRYHVERLELFAVANARGLGWSWRDIGDALGVAKQVLHRRYAQAFPRPRRRGQHH